MAATPSPGQPTVLSPSTPGLAPTAHLDVDGILKQLDAVEAQGTLLFDRIKEALTVPYADEDAISDCMRLHELINQLEAQLKANVLVQWAEPSAVPLAQLNAEYSARVTALHEEREKIQNSARAAKRQLGDAGASLGKRV